MFDIFFGWRKASKCKKLIKRVQCRLKLLKNKRHSIVKQLRQDMAQLIKLGYQETAFNRAEQLFKDECAVAVYEMLDNFCEFVILNFSYIRKHKDIPNDVNEAVSNLIFASARCGDLPELPRIRELFGKRYGPRFAAAAVDLLPGNLVNREMKEKLSADAVSDEVKYRLVDEIAKDYCLRPEVLSLEYHSESKQQLQQYQNQVPKANILTIGDSEGREIHRPLSSSESSPYDFPEEMVVYLDDIEEFLSSPKDGDLQDQRMFMFKSYKLPETETEASVKSGSESPMSLVDQEKIEKSVSIISRTGKTCMSREKTFSAAKRSTQVYGEHHESYYRKPSLISHRSRVEETRADKDVRAEEEHSPRYSTSSSSSSRSENPLPPYSRARTMPQQRPNVSNLMESFPRSVSCTLQHSTHVHPKLPNYDEIAAKFSALKMQCLQNKKPCDGR